MGQFICGECFEEMKKMPDKSINFIFTSPPYADQIKDYGKTGVMIKPDKFCEWFLPRAQEMFRILKDDGSFVLNINDKLDGKFQSIFVFKLVVMLVEQVGFHLVRDYVWYNPATPPNVFSRGTMGRTKKSHEYCFWFSKSDEWTFNMDPIRKPYSERMQELFEAGPQGNREDNTRPSRHNFDLSRQWKDNGGADPGSVISISNTSSNDMLHKLCKQFGVKHPARFPEKLVEFFLLAGTNEGDVVLDPFGGSGTTAVVAQRLNRDFKYIEINPDFCDIAQKWHYVEFNADAIARENVIKFCDDILSRCKWDILPMSFLYDCYKKWMIDNVVYRIPQTKKEFVSVLLEVLRDNDYGWASKIKTLLTNGRMEVAEPLIIEYDLKRWMNTSCDQTDINMVCKPKLQKSYKGIERVKNG